MAQVWADRVLEASSGTGPFGTSGAVTGFQRFSDIDGIQIGDTAKGAVIAIGANNLPSGDWATGTLTYSGVNQITLSDLEDSSNGGAAVTWTAGNKWVMLCPTGADMAKLIEATVAQVWAGTTSDAYITPKVARDAMVPTALVSTSTITPNFAQGFNFTLTLAHNATLANPTNAQVGDSGSIIITQDGTGGRTLVYESDWVFPAGEPTLQTTAAAVDVLCYYVSAAGTIIASMIQPDTTLAAAEAYTDAAIAAIAGNGTGTPANGVVSGLGLVYTGSGLVWSLTAGSANINGELVTASAQTVTLAAADATNPRLDTFYLDDTGTFGKITGTAATNPSLPTVDPTSQLYLGFALVPATATDLTSTITTEPIYTEGSEWTGTASGSGVTIGSTNNPKTGTKCIEFTAVAANAYAKFVDGSPSSFDGTSSTLFSIRSQGSWNSKRSINIQYFNASGVAQGAPVVFKQGSFGFVSSNTGGYQDIVIPETLFAVAPGTVRGELRFTCKGNGGTMGFYLDDIKVQTIAAGSGGTGGGGVSSGITQDQADARYLKLTGGSLTGDLIVPDEAYDATAWNGSLEVPTKNAVRDKIEAIVAGGGYTDEQAQDAVGAMVDSTLIYVDATPVLKRAPITGHVTIADGSNAAALGSFTKAQLDAAVSDGNVLYVGDAYSISATDAAIAAAVAGLSWKQAVRVATTANGTLATAFENGDTVDGVVLATGNRILIKNQSSGAENGIYTVNASGAPTRATDADSGAELVNASCYVSEGTTNADTQWTCTTNATITVGSTSLAFAQLTSGGGTISTLTGDVTASGSGSVVATIANDVVTFAKIQNATANSKLLGSGASGSGADYTEITVGSGLTMAGTTLSASGGGSDDTAQHALCGGI